nr:immunoglobulin heavy chain junction region [Mus musculus]
CAREVYYGYDVGAMDYW